jgi:hypothetical protein
MAGALNMDAILFSANTDMVNVNDAIDHLKYNDKVYWEVGFNIKPNNFPSTIDGYMHITGRKEKYKNVKYKATINKIIKFSKDDYNNEAISLHVKPKSWLKEWKENKETRKYKNGIQNYDWKWTLVITKIERFPYETLKFFKIDGSNVKWPPRSYIRVRPPNKL